MTGKEKRREIAIAKGYVKPKPKNETIYKRTEGNIQFHYNESAANAYAGFSSAERDRGVIPSFSIFYDQMSEKHKAQVRIKYLN